MALFVHINTYQNECEEVSVLTQLTTFEPDWFQVHLLTHSATTTYMQLINYTV